MRKIKACLSVNVRTGRRERIKNMFFISIDYIGLDNNSS
jgi:hypothetical protein